MPSVASSCLMHAPIRCANEGETEPTAAATSPRTTELGDASRSPHQPRSCRACSTTLPKKPSIHADSAALVAPSCPALKDCQVASTRSCTLLRYTSAATVSRPMLSSTSRYWATLMAPAPPAAPPPTVTCFSSGTTLASTPSVHSSSCFSYSLPCRSSPTTACCASASQSVQR